MEPDVPTDDPWSHSHLFTLRVWYEALDAEQREVRVQVRHVLSGETRYFRDWVACEAYLTGKIDETPET